MFEAVFDTDIEANAFVRERFEKIVSNTRNCQTVSVNVRTSKRD